MDKNIILKAIDEGLRKSLINFGNSGIQKSLSNEDLNKLKIKDEIEKILKGDGIMPSDLYAELIKNKNIGIYEFNDETNRLIWGIGFSIRSGELKTSEINLNWIDVNDDSIKKFKFYDTMVASEDLSNIILDISEWNILNIYPDMFSLSKFTEIKLPNALNTICHLAFASCTKLLKIDISAYSINRYAFCDCVSLESVNIENRLTRICFGAFNGCYKLQEIYLPKTLKEILSSAFSDCRSLHKIIYGGTKSEWKNINIYDKAFVYGDIADLHNIHFTVKCIDGEINY